MSAIRMFPQYECRSCIEKKKQAERGCEKDAPFAFWNDLDGEPRTRCPRRPIFEDPHWYNSIIEAYNAYKNGFLPHAGGLMDQPALFPFIMSTVDDIMQTCDRIEMERRSQANNRGQGDSVFGKRG